MRPTEATAELHTVADAVRRVLAPTGIPPDRWIGHPDPRIDIAVRCLLVSAGAATDNRPRGRHGETSDDRQYRRTVQAALKALDDRDADRGPVSESTLRAWDEIAMGNLSQAATVQDLREQARPLPTYGEWGTYPLLYLDADGNVLCAPCATIERRHERPTTAHVNYGPPTTCDVCGAEVRAAHQRLRPG